MPFKNLLSRTGRNRHPSAIQFNCKEELCAKWDAEPEDFVELNHGDPNERWFPWTKFTMELNDGTSVSLDKDELATVLQYLPTVGYQPLLDSLSSLMLRFHKGEGILNKEGEWGVIACCGAMDGVSKSFDMFLDEGDTYLLEIPCYANILASLHPYGGHPICCDVDQDGLDPVQIRKKIEEAKAKGLPTPKFLYTCPTATNPAGLTTSAERRREIYKMACEYDFFIIEDDPYFFVRFDEELFKNIPSYLALDTEGRVIRIDSFSKSLSSGIRLGWITASKEVIDKMILHTESTVMHASGVSQAIVAKLFEHWGIDKFLEHTKKVANFYRKQMETMCAVVDKNLGDIVEYQKPNGGLFLWMKIPKIKDTQFLVQIRAASKLVMFVHGTAFQPDFADPDQIANGGFRQYIRAAYSQVTPKEMDTVRIFSCFFLNLFSLSFTGFPSLT